MILFPKIVQQLSNLGDRLAVIEGSTRPRPYKKTGDVKQIKSSNKVKRSKAADTRSLARGDWCKFGKQSDPKP